MHTRKEATVTNVARMAAATPLFVMLTMFLVVISISIVAISR